MSKRIVFIFFCVVVVIGSVGYYCWTLINKRNDDADFIRLMVAPTTSKKQWEKDLEEGKWVVKGTTVEQTSTVGKTSSERSQTYTRIDGWPESCHLPEEIKEKATILAAGVMISNPPLTGWSQEIVTCNIALNQQQIVALLENAGWKHIADVIQGYEETLASQYRKQGRDLEEWIDLSSYENEPSYFSPTNSDGIFILRSNADETLFQWRTGNLGSHPPLYEHPAVLPDP